MQAEGIGRMRRARRRDPSGPGDFWLAYSPYASGGSSWDKVARYRLVRGQSRFRKTTEITVHPDQQLTDELALAIAASAPWLSSYFRGEGGGGG